MPYEVTSNIDRVADQMERFLDDFGFDAPAESGGPLGEALVDHLTYNIADRGKAGSGADGTWDRNAKSTIRQKGRDEPNVESKQMLAPPNIKGEPEYAKEEIKWKYGRNEPAPNRRQGRAQTDREKAHYAQKEGQSYLQTDREKAHYAQKEGQSYLQIKRPFFELNEQDRTEATDIGQKALDRRVRDENSR